VTGKRPTFPLIPRRPVTGIRVGGLRSARRGTGFEVAGSRPYRPGDDIRRIDRYASARLSAATAQDAFVVREHYAEEATRVVIAVDERPTMSLYPEGLPWLHKPAAVAAAARLIDDSAAEARCVVTRASGLEELLEHRRPLPPGAFVFLVSDFLELPPDSAWAAALARRWDVVPVVVQDPTWEQTFPDVGGVVLAVADARGGRARFVRLSRPEARARRDENEARLVRIRARFHALGLAPIELATDDSGAIHTAFAEWADGRRRGPRWLR
jgi:uncharacterized protein (DUF58 family)